VDYAAELRYAEMQLFVQQLVLSHPLYVPTGRGVIMDLQPVRLQVQHPLHRPMTAAFYEPVHHLLHELQISFGAASRWAGHTLIHAVVIAVVRLVAAIILRI
jgi:hypothetical protein